MAEKDIENDILRHLADNTGDDFTDDVTDNAGDDSGDAGENEGSTGRAARSRNQSADADDTGGRTGVSGSKSAQPAGSQRGQQPAGKNGEQRPRTDAKGNLLGPDGSILASAGAERRYAERLNVRNQHLERELSETAKKLADVQFLNDVPRRLGLSNDDVTTGLQLVADFNRSPVEVARKVLEKALAAGHNLSEILGEGTSSVEMRGINALLESKLKPFTDAAQKNEVTEAARNEGEKNYSKFMTDYPEAEPHQDAIASLMRTKGWTAEKSLMNIQRFALSNGLDFSEPLGPQIAARANSDQTGGDDTEQPTRHRQGMPNGQGGGSQYRATTPDTADKSFDAIIRESMAEAGIRI